MLHLTRSRIHDSKTDKSKENGSHQNGLPLGPIDCPKVGKVSHHSIELTWEKMDKNAAKGDHSRLKYCIQEEDKRTMGFGTVYVGYADNYNIEGLEPLQKYKYRLKITNEKGESSHSPVLEVTTTKEPFNSHHLHRAILQKNEAKVEEILVSREANIEAADKLGFTPLMSAAQAGHINIVNMLIKAGADVNAANSSGKTGLMFACFAGHIEVVKLLHEYGATWDCRDRGGSSPVHWAVDSANVELIQWMIQNGARIDVKDTTAQWTPLLRCAALSGNVGIAEVLIANHADVNATDKDGKTPLMIATLNGHLDLVKLLIKSGADVNTLSKYGKTAIDMAKAFDRRHIIQYYEENFPQDNA